MSAYETQNALPVQEQSVENVELRPASACNTPKVESTALQDALKQARQGLEATLGDDFETLISKVSKRHLNTDSASVLKPLNPLKVQKRKPEKAPNRYMSRSHLEYWLDRYLSPGLLLGAPLHTVIEVYEEVQPNHYELARRYFETGKGFEVMAEGNDKALSRESDKISSEETSGVLSEETGKALNKETEKH